MADEPGAAEIEALLLQARTLDGEARERWLQELTLRSPAEATTLRRLLSGEAAVATQVLSSVATTGPGSPLRESQDQRVGPYRLLRPIGRGGMGEVWLAERADEAYSKVVAIKFVGATLGNREAIEWFRRERQALARLEHPHIARLLDGGETDDGRPYLVMEFVDGVPLDSFADGLPIERVLRLFLQICAAVEHAHRALIVHRDIKPANVLVTPEGESKLLDFGIAKEVAPVAEDDGRTKTSAFTLHYASPEQMNGQPITVASDVYSLGAVLYRLLTGKMPYAGCSTALAQLQAIQNDALEKPSRAVLSSPWLQDAERRKHARRLAGDIDDIVRRCLRFEASARYGSVRELADDIQRHLSYQPVLARRGSFGYRASRWLRRNWLAVGASAAVLVTLGAGVWATHWQAQLAEQQRALAQKRFDLSRGLVKDVLFDFHDRIASVPGTIEARRQLVARTKKYLQELGEGAQDDPRLLADMALVERRLGDISGNPQFPNLGDAPAARQHFARAEALSRRALSLRPDDPALAHALARTLSARGLFAYWDDDLKTAEKAYRAAIPLFAAELKRAPSKEVSLQHASAVIGLGDVQFWNGQLQEALATYDSVCKERVAAAKKDASLIDSAGICHTRRADTLAWLDRYPEANAEIDQALAIVEQQLKASPDDSDVAHGYIVTQSKRGEILDWSGQKELALDAMSQGLQLAQRMARAEPSDLRAMRNVALMHSKRGDVWLEMGRLREALDDFRQGLEGYLELSKRDPTQAEYRRDIAAAHKRLGLAYLQAGDGARSAAHLDESLKTARERYALAKQAPAARRDLAVALGERIRARGELRLRCGWVAETLALWQGLQKDGLLSPSDEPQLQETRKKGSDLGCDGSPRPGVSAETLLPEARE